tara:strand:+ start:238 stop:828 length:591 start_codon:yes stop_codon:yes gene_type:complete
MFYVFGLGNPGKEYNKTRHNIGRDVLLSVAESEGNTSWQHDKYANAQVTRLSLGHKPVEFWLPETFMNRSGETVAYVKKEVDANDSQFLVVYDDVDLPLGEVKVSRGKGDGGHNGIKSIIKALGSKDFVRIRIGVAPKSLWTGKTARPSGHNLSKHVLGKFGYFERSKVEDLANIVTNILKVIVSEGVDTAMNRFN